MPFSKVRYWGGLSEKLLDLCHKKHFVHVIFTKQFTPYFFPTWLNSLVWSCDFDGLVVPDTEWHLSSDLSSQNLKLQLLSRMQSKVLILAIELADFCLLFWIHHLIWDPKLTHYLRSKLAVGLHIQKLMYLKFEN